ncbi:hypothetical protein [Thermovibrio ammonificans]
MRKLLTLLTVAGLVASCGGGGGSVSGSYDATTPTTTTDTTTTTSDTTAPATGYAIDSPIVKGVITENGFIVGAVENGTAQINASDVAVDSVEGATLCVSGYDQDGNWWVGEVGDVEGFAGLCVHLTPAEWEQVASGEKKLLFAPTLEVSVELDQLGIAPELKNQLLAQAGINPTDYKLIDANATLSDAEQVVNDLAGQLGVEYNKQWEWRARLVYKLLKAEYELGYGTAQDKKPPINLKNVPEITIVNAVPTTEVATTPYDAETANFVGYADYYSEEEGGYLLEDSYPARVFGDYAIGFQSVGNDFPLMFFGVKDSESGNYVIVAKEYTWIGRAIGQAYGLYIDNSNNYGSCLYEAPDGTKKLYVSPYDYGAIDCDMDANGTITCVISAKVYATEPSENELNKLPACPQAVIDAYNNDSVISAKGELVLSQMGKDMDALYHDPVKECKKLLEQE